MPYSTNINNSPINGSKYKHAHILNLHYSHTNIMFTVTRQLPQLCKITADRCLAESITNTIYIGSLQSRKLTQFLETHFPHTKYI